MRGYSKGNWDYGPALRLGRFCRGGARSIEDRRQSSDDARSETRDSIPSTGELVEEAENGHIQNGFPRTLRFRCLRRLKGQQTYSETSILAIPAKLGDFESWREPIEKLVLFDFKL